MASPIGSVKLRLAAPEIGVAAGGGHVRTIGPLLLARLGLPAGGERALGCAPGLLGQYVALHFLPAGRIRQAGAPAMPCAAGDVLVVDAAERWSIVATASVDGRTLFAPRARLAAALPAGRGSRLLPCSGALLAVGRHLELLLGETAAELDVRQQELAARAIVELVLAALAAGAGHASPRQEAGLLDRVVAAIDAGPGEAWDSPRLCATLGCSRSSLYRAAAPAGGVAELIVQRRLIAVRRRLGDPGDARPIAAIAGEHGFADAARFGRRFKRQFGVTAGEYRGTVAIDPATAPPVPAWR